MGVSLDVPNSNDIPFYVTAANTTSLSAFNSSDATCNAFPFCVTATNTTSLSAFNSTDAIFNASPFCLTASNVIFLIDLICKVAFS